MALSSMNLSAEVVAKSLGISLSSAMQENPHEASPLSSFCKIASDSRTVTPGCLFVALQGENFDGHQFIESAIVQGATGILCKKGTRIQTAAAQPVWVFFVDNTLEAYRQLAHAWRQ